MAHVKAPAARPLSPHLQIYRWSWTMAMSVFHRVTGVALYGGTALVAIWFLAMASGPDAYASASWWFGTPVGLFLMFAYTWTLMHHMLGGVRHLVWDFGKGLEPGTRFWMARMTLIGSTGLTLLIWIVAWFWR